MIHVIIGSIFHFVDSAEDGLLTCVTPFLFWGTNDHFVARIRPQGNGKFIIDDGGDTQWFTVISGNNFCRDSVIQTLRNLSVNSEVEVNDQGVVQITSQDEAGISLAVVRLGQVVTTLYASLISRKK